MSPLERGGTAMVYRAQRLGETAFLGYEGEGHEGEGSVRAIVRDFLANDKQHLLAYNKKLYLCPSSNPPSVLGGISLSSQPEQVQDLTLVLALLHSGRHFHFSIKFILRPSRPS